MKELRMKLAFLTIVFFGWVSLPGVDPLPTEGERVSSIRSATLQLETFCPNLIITSPCAQQRVAVTDSSTVVEVCQTSKAYVICQTKNCAQQQVDSFYTLASDIQKSWAYYNMSADMNILISEAAEMRAACQPSYKTGNPCSSEDGAVSNARDNNMMCLALKVFTSCVERYCVDKDVNYNKIETVKNNPTCNHAAAIGTPALLLLLLVGTRYAV